MFQVYAISSQTREYIYVGLTSDLENRITRHNSGYERTTKPYRPFKLIYSEEFPDRSSARRREKELKTSHGKRFLKALLK
ncbi:GIY-YIG nuclease family protein [Algoriphagus lutimaris]|uniref:GIY-YIG nuclease family protein n=1 Tax=Algoriphagus lutimaris TaxID=613197 RepID=UPI00196BA363|nr:GIY-YIG nuclease family protein [Algoriphagus lutimaris]MBN3521221.1 GIY-YIG nuclease family protein [Algoriphagus lutimaris]